MTHFITGILVPNSVYKDGNTKRFIDRIMEPYSEHLEVESYISKTADEVREEYEEASKKHPEYKDMDIEEWSEKWYGEKLDKEGNLLSTFNQDSFYDWYRVGGRWDGYLTDNRRRSDNGFNFDDIHEEVENNSISVEDMIKNIDNYEYLPGKLLDTDGSVYEHRKYGWFGMSEDVKGDDIWKKEFVQVLHNNRDCYLVSLDCHV